MQAAPVPGDIIVGTVDDRPIWGSCVAAQMKRGAKTREAAMNECVSFELLAKAAEARGLATYSEVVDGTRRALVSRFVELEFDPKYRSIADLRDEVDQAIAPRIAGMPDVLNESRTAAHALVKVPPDAAAGVVEERRRIAEQIHAAVANETGLMLEHIRAIAEPIAKRAGLPADELYVSQEPAYRGQAWEPAFVEGLYAIPEVGRASPVVRTKFGWHVIVFADLDPSRTKQELKPKLEEDAFIKLRLAKFAQWVDEMARARGIAIAKNPKQLEGEP